MEYLLQFCVVVAMIHSVNLCDCFIAIAILRSRVVSISAYRFGESLYDVQRLAKCVCRPNVKLNALLNPPGQFSLRHVVPAQPSSLSLPSGKPTDARK